MDRKVGHAIAFATLLFLPASGSANPGPEMADRQIDEDLADLVALLPGRFDNSSQIKSLNKRALSTSELSKYSLLYHYRQRINSEGLPGHWIYAQITQGKSRGKIYRQTVSEFYVDKSGHILSRVWRFKNPQMKSRGTPATTTLDKLSRDDLELMLPDGCENTWHRRGAQFEGKIDHRNCVIHSRYKDEKRQLFAEEIVFEEGMWGREGAYTMSGELAFGLLDNNFFRYERLSPTSSRAD